VFPVFPPPPPGTPDTFPTVAPGPPLTSITPVTTTSLVALKSRRPVPDVVTVTPEGMLMVVKLWIPGERATLAVGLNAPSAPVLTTVVHWPLTHPAVEKAPPWHIAHAEPQCRGSVCVE
jgi:hypothetical protein